LVISTGTKTEFRDKLTQPIYDVFEPGFIQDALNESNKPTNLGPLIFGEEHWRNLGREVPQSDDPLTQIFRQRGDTYFFPCGLQANFCCFLGLLETPTFLPEYDSLIPPKTDHRRLQRVKTKVYRIAGKGKQIWSITPAFPEKLQPFHHSSQTEYVFFSF
jgi:hypothetical protein